MDSTNWLHEVNEGIFKFKDRYRKVFGRNYESRERRRMPMSNSNCNKLIRLLPEEMTRAQTPPRAGEANGAPPGEK